MNYFGVVIIFAIAILQVVVAVNPKFDDHWEKFKQEHGKDYDNEEEEQRRREHFENHVKTVAEHNVKFDMGLESFQMSVNHEHADKPFDEFQKTMLGAMPPGFYDGRNRTDFSKILTSRAVTSIDWTKGTSRVTSVKNQGSCGSCWAFATAGALEGQFYTCNKALQDVSMQYILDCASKSPENEKQYDSYGCDGGWPASAMKMVVDKGGVALLSDYPYKGQVGAISYYGVYDNNHWWEELANLIPYKSPREFWVFWDIVGPSYLCMTNKTTCPTNKRLVVPIIKPVTVGPQGDENAMSNALASKGPLSIAIQVDSKMQNYKTGIFSSTTCNKGVNHAVLVVGTGTENGKDYWKIKNSWGPGWGENGYIRIQRNAGNMCLTASYPSYPIPDCSKM